ncbi:MAG: hypothetical protein ACP5E3_07970 [Bacteroidales bacterium]
MKNILHLFIITILLISNINCAQSQNKNEQVIEMLKEFYTAYNKAWENIDDPLTLKNTLVSLQQKYCSEKLQNKLKDFYKMYGLDHDLLLDDVGTDTITLQKTLSVTKDLEKDNSYVVSYIANIEDPDKTLKKKVTIHLTVVNEKDSFKIDQVW